MPDEMYTVSFIGWRYRVIKWRIKIMMRSLYSAVSGLRVHQTKMDVIGNNISNVNTVAYKSQSVTFSDVYYQTTQTATGPSADTGKGGSNAMQIGLGASVGSISTSIETEGAAQRTDNAFDLKLAGSSFFVVNDGGSTYFTRAGDFTKDAAGNLVTTSGAKVMGWQVDDNGNVVKDTVTPLSVMGPKFTYTDPAATTNISFSGNINQDDKKFDNAGSEPMVFNFIDSLGYEYQGTLNLTQDATDSTKYNVTMGKITCDGVETNLTAALTPASFQFNKDTGSIIANGAAGTNTTNFSMTFSTVATTDPAIKQVTTTINPITADITKLTMRGDATKITPALGDADGNGAGKKVGKMKSVGIATDGSIVATYSNGDNRTIGQIAVATFTNPAGLEKVGGNMYQSTLNSGEFDGVGTDVTSTKGSITSGQLEMSNVDLSAEFTEMITTQRGFQANSRIITVSDTMIEELVNLKR